MWEKLLSLKKQGDTKKRYRKDEPKTRIGFEVDYDRVVFSNHFRSLQDKTQVIPLSKKGFVHTRLTHSMEVSVVGRSLGRLVGEALLKKYPTLEKSAYTIQDFGAIVACGALAHDIGNPPFGHSGEKAIGEFFRHQQGRVLHQMLPQKQYQDLCDFEGNANGFRILTQSQGGLRLSYATLGAFIKYPKQSLPKNPSEKIWDKKYNIFQTETAIFEDLAQELGLLYCPDTQSYVRHPLAFLVEAADDICYSIIDFEDGVNLGWISRQMAFDYLLPIVSSEKNAQQVLKKYQQLPTKQDAIGYLRAVCIGNLLQEAARVFIENESAILQGDFHQSLLQGSKYQEQLKEIIKLSVTQIYQSEEVLQKEISGHEILQHLLQKYFTSLMNFYKAETTAYDELLLKTLPQSEFSIECITQKSLYENTLNLVCFLASLTDTQVMEYAKK